MGQLGTVRAQEHLRDILFSVGITSPLLPNNEVYIGAVHEKMDESGKLIHEPTIGFRYRGEQFHDVDERPQINIKYGALWQLPAKGLFL